MKQLTDVEVFVRVVDSGSYAAAAKALEISRSHASRMVTALEARLGVRLLHRTTRRVSTTQTGLAFYEASAPLLEALTAAESRATAERDDIVGILRISVPVSLCRRYLTDPLNRFQAQHPELVLMVEVSDRKVDLVGEAFDVAIRGGTVDNATLVAKRLWPFRAGIWASPAYIRAHGQPKTPAELAKHRVLTYSGSSNPRQWRLRRGADEVTVHVSGPLICNSADYLLASARAGLGIVYLPDFETIEVAAEGELVRVLPAWEGVPSHFWAVRPHRTHLPARVRAFLDFIGELWAVPPWAAPGDVPQLTQVAPARAAEKARATAR